MLHRGVELHRILPEQAVAVQADDLCVGLGGLRANREGQTHTHRAERSRIEPVAGDEDRDRLMAQFKILLAIDDEDRGAAPGLANVTSPAAKLRPDR